MIFLLVSFITYFVVSWPFHERLPRISPADWALAILIPFQLAPLLYYKYAGFLANDVLQLHWQGLSGLVVPIGISFYTFQKIAYACDSLALGKEMPNLLDFMTFAGFFPQIVAGPIERRDELLPQLQAFRFRWSAKNLNDGATWIALGLFFKRCLADNFADIFQPTIGGNAWIIWLDNILFGLRIYYDFAGYSLIALGLARCLGVRLTLNFRESLLQPQPVGVLASLARHPQPMAARLSLHPARRKPRPFLDLQCVRGFSRFGHLAWRWMEFRPLGSFSARLSSLSIVSSAERNPGRLRRLGAYDGCGLLLLAQLLRDRFRSAAAENRSPFFRERL